jgi:hypothetical protein
MKTLFAFIEKKCEIQQTNAWENHAKVVKHFLPLWSQKAENGVDY